MWRAIVCYFAVFTWIVLYKSAEIIFCYSGVKAVMIKETVGEKAVNKFSSSVIIVLLESQKCWQETAS